MKTMLKILPILFLISVANIFPQDKPSLDKWRGMVLDVTTSSQALEAFKNPKEDKTGQSFRPIKYNEWFAVKDNKSFRMIHWENIEGFPDVKLYFLGDKLVVIHLEPQKLGASLLNQTYGVEFEPIFTGFDKAIDQKNYDRSNGKTQARSFPSLYFLMYKAEKSYAFALVSNGSFGAMLQKSMGVEDDANSLPGKVTAFQLISRSLENNKGSDLLK
jgi:hypothetical protein